MKRSEAIKMLIHKVISPFEIIKQEYYENGIYEQRAKDLLDFLENKMGMVPPLCRKNDGPWDEAYDVNEWEPEDEKK